MPPLYATIFASENPAPQCFPSSSNYPEQDKFFGENRLRKDEPLGKPVAPALADHPATNNGRDMLRGRDDNNYYITSVNAKRNPDLIIPGGAIKGNMYFRRHVDPDKDEPQANDSQFG